MQYYCRNVSVRCFYKTDNNSGNAESFLEQMSHLANTADLNRNFSSTKNVRCLVQNGEQEVKDNNALLFLNAKRINDFCSTSTAIIDNTNIIINDLLKHLTSINTTLLSRFLLRVLTYTGWSVYL